MKIRIQFYTIFKLIFSVVQRKRKKLEILVSKYEDLLKDQELIKLFESVTTKMKSIMAVNNFKYGN